MPRLRKTESPSLNGIPVPPVPPFVRKSSPAPETFFSPETAFPGTLKRESTESREQNRLVLGQGVGMRGRISTCRHLVVEGRLKKGKVTAQHLEICRSGHFDGTAKGTSAEIRGHFTGHLKISGHLLLRKTAEVTGRISYGSLTVEEGARLKGALRFHVAKQGAR